MKENKRRVKSRNSSPRTRPNQKLFKEKKVNSNVELLTFLLDNFTSMSRNNIKKLLANQQILVNGAAVRQFDFLLAKGDIVSISPYKVRKDGKRVSKLKILYEDDELIVINKPAGLLTIATDKEKEQTAYRLMMDYVREENPKNRVFVVHRLDKETSGVLLFSKSENLKDLLQDRWNDLVQTREYIAICEGIFNKKEGTRVSYLLPTKTNLMFSSHKPNDGQKAITHYQVIEENEEYSILKVKIDTGRKNQIRVHMKDLGHNVVGDDKYGSEKNPINRLGLHARVLEFEHPVNDKHFKFIADVPKEFLDLFCLKKIK
ncbi:MAG: RluA family pseudouridine synthase [Erysipelotrichaceae bacterium]|nr:RluA family pseudouridine synthase [Erysipelotrichaceae bacterium]